MSTSEPKFRRSPFQIAERYIELSKVWESDEWFPWIKHINEMILMPLIAFFSYATNMSDMLFFATTFMTAWGAWVEFSEFTELKFTMQRMRLRAMRVGGPFIRTNDPTYLPYVWADSVIRHPADLRFQIE
jgi:hypothetical protein